MHDPAQPESSSKGSPRPAESPRSTLAVIAFISSLVLCCPLASLVGLVLGFRAMRQVRDSNERLRGAGWARAAVLIGVAGLVVQCSGFNGFVSWYQDELEKAIINAVEVTLRDPATAATEVWDDDADRTALTERMTAFAAEARNRYGDLQLVRFTTAPTIGAAGGSEVHVPVTFRFESGQRIGGVVVDLKVAASLSPLVAMHEIVISDRERGDLAVRLITSDETDTRQ